MHLKYRTLITLNIYMLATMVLLLFGTFLAYLMLLPGVAFLVLGGRKHA